MKEKLIKLSVDTHLKKTLFLADNLEISRN